jgi:hypothetical protein
MSQCPPKRQTWSIAEHERMADIALKKHPSVRETYYPLQSKPTITKTESEDSMSKKNKTKKVKAEKKSKTARKGGSLGDIFGFAVTAVIRTLGANGVTIKQMQAILDAKKIKMPPASVSVQLGFGRNGSDRPLAELSKAQIAELVKLAPADDEKPKAKSKAPAKKKSKAPAKKKAAVEPLSEPKPEESVAAGE